MGAADQRIAELEHQIADLETRFAQLKQSAFCLKTLEEMLVEHAGYPVAQRAALRISRSRHLQALEGGRQ
jgi:hypothetical protein